MLSDLASIKILIIPGSNQCSETLIKQGIDGNIFQLCTLQLMTTDALMSAKIGFLYETTTKGTFHTLTVCCIKPVERSPPNVHSNVSKQRSHLMSPSRRWKKLYCKRLIHCPQVVPLYYFEPDTNKLLKNQILDTYIRLNYLWMA